MSYFKLEWIPKYISENDPKVFLDIGSHNGSDGKLFKQEYPSSRVISIEADPTLYEKMRANKKNVGLEMFNYAICDKDGPVIFYKAAGERLGIGSIHKPKDAIYKIKNAKFADPISVEGMRIDTLATKLGFNDIDVVHMDIQTAEYEALVGMGNLRPRIIFLEVGGYSIYENARPTDDLLISMGYKNIPIDEITKGDKLWIRL